MGKRSYYGSPGGTRNPFGSSGKRTHEKLPPLPSTAGLLLSLMEYASKAWRHEPYEPWAWAALDVLDLLDRAYIDEMSA